MRHLTKAILFVMLIALPVLSQQTLEKEAWEFSQSYDRATLRNDVAFLERYLDEKFISVGPNSVVWDKEQCLDNARKGAAGNVDFSLVDLKSFPIKIIVSGNVVIIISNWKVSRKANSVVNAPVQVDSGTTTAVYQKETEWRLLSEHVAFDKAPESDEIGAIGRIAQIAGRSLVNRNYVDLDTQLSPGYSRVDENGVSLSREQYLADLRGSRLKISGIRLSSVYVNTHKNSAVETGVVNLIGSQNDIPFNKTLEYTRMWLKRDDKWKVSAEYFRSIQP
jgi:ketosteroid isomerase-like protein